MSLLRQIYYKLFRKKYKFLRIGSNVNIGQDCIINSASMVEIGNNCSIGPNAVIYSIYKKIIIKDYVMLGPHVTIVSGDHNIRKIGVPIINNHHKDPKDDQDIIIEEDVWIGANVTILKGVTIGRGSVIAAGALVNKSVPPYTIWGGVPGHILNIRFNIEEILKHESYIYKEKDRLPIEKLVHIKNFHKND